MVLLVDCHLFGQVLHGDVVLFLHLANPGLQGFLVFLALCQLDLNVSETLLQFLDFSLGNAKVSDQGLAVDLIGGLHHRHVGREIALDLQRSQSERLQLTAVVIF